MTQITIKIMKLIDFDYIILKKLNSNTCHQRKELESIDVKVSYLEMGDNNK